MKNGTPVKLKSTALHGADRHGVPHGQSMREARGVVVGNNSLARPHIHWDGMDEGDFKEVSTEYLEVAADAETRRPGMGDFDEAPLPRSHPPLTVDAGGPYPRPGHSE